MSEADSDLAEKIISMLLAVPETQRAGIVSHIRHNGIFCADCGWGSRDHPNPDCQCMNDE
jgi:hypothetical protein